MAQMLDRISCGSLIQKHLYAAETLAGEITKVGPGGNSEMVLVCLWGLGLGVANCMRKQLFSSRPIRATRITDYCRASVSGLDFASDPPGRGGVFPHLG